MQDDNPRTSFPRSRVQRIYSALLRLFPFEFRAEFGRDMAQVFSEEHEDVRSRRSLIETVAFWFRTAKDFARTAPRQHWDVLLQDVRVGARLLRRNPGFATTAILTLALGIGGSTSIFSVVYAVVLRPLAFPESERVVRIGWKAEGDQAGQALWPTSHRDLLALREHCTAFDAIGGMRYDALSSENGPVRVLLPETTGIGGVGQSFRGSIMASASLFKVFGASTVIGRLPDEQDEQPGATPVVAISYGTWTSLYGRDPGVIGRSLIRHLAGRPTSVTIVGVAAPGAFEYPQHASPESLAWASLDADVIRDDRERKTFNMSVYARLAPDVSLETARAQVARLTPHLASDLPKFLEPGKSSLEVMPLRDQIAGRARTPLLVFLGAVSCLLLVASVNVTSLVLARAISRRREFAARFALGARPLRIARQLLTESALLAIVGGALGLGFAWAARRAFVAISLPMPRLDESDIGAAALVFALAGMLIATSVAGLVPALQASRRSVVDGLRRAGGAPGTATLFSAPLATLAAAEVALVLVLLAGTGLLVNSFARLMLFDLGFDARSMVMFTIDRSMTPPLPSAPTTRNAAEQTVALLSDRQRQMLTIDDEVIQRVSRIPGVSAAALTGDDPFGPPYRYAVDLRIGDARTAAEAALRIASPSAFEGLRLRVVAGRWFTSGDRDGTPLVAVVNETMARRFWRGHSVMEDRIIFGYRTLQVIGVVADVRDRGAREDVKPAFYVSTTQMPPDPVMLVVRVAPGLRGIDNVIDAELAQMGGRIRPHSPRRPEDIWWQQMADARFLTLVLSVFSVLALAVALAGVYGVLRSIVVQRTREMGIRKALGASRADLVRLIIGQALRFTLPGCLVGLIAAAVTGSAIRSMLFGISPTDPLTLVAATLLLIATVLAGAYFPARRAGAVDPALSLRAE